MYDPNVLLSYGPPPLTQLAADCALDLIDFMAAVVRGVDTIHVTETMRELWYTHLANHYPMLPPMDRVWFANAAVSRANLNMAWPQMDPMTREMYRQSWAATLPATLQFIEPVLQAAYLDVVHHSARQVMNQPQQPRQAPSVQSTGDSAINLGRFSNQMTDLTINLMRSMNRH